MNIDESVVEELIRQPEMKSVIDKIIRHFENRAGDLQKKIDSYESHKKSPFLKGSVNSIEYRSQINRKAVIENEFGKKIDETLGTMYYFKEKTRELAHIAALDPDEMRMAFTEGIQNVLEHGHGDDVEIVISVNNINTDNVYLQMSFKHFLDSKDFYSLKDANKNANEGIMDFENSRGRGEYMMREIMDERKFINGFEKNDDGTSYYFFKRIMRKYKIPKKHESSSRLSDEFKNYIDSLQDYNSAMFVRMDYYTNKKEIILSENKGRINDINKIMDRHGYVQKGSDRYRNTNFTFWEGDLKLLESKTGFDEIINELKGIVYEANK
jgi:anti-sigma regulatory factor (Ser/Thr protein kinase)